MESYLTKWKVEGDSAVVSEDGMMECNVYCTINAQPNTKAKKQIAKLIASAPDLLLFVKGIMNGARTGNIVGVNQDRAEELIALSEGK